MKSPGAKTIEAMLWLYDFLSVVIVILFTLLVSFLIWLLIPNEMDKRTEEQKKKAQKEIGLKSLANLAHRNIIEVIWTISPVIILTLVAYPSFDLLYYYDAVSTPVLTIKIIGSQWYWSYDVPPQSYFETRGLTSFQALEKDADLPIRLLDDIRSNEDSVELLNSIVALREVQIGEEDGDSYMLDVAELEEGEYRLLTPEPTVRLPVGVPFRFVIVGSDVLHSFAIPALGIKLDAVPGRVNQVSVYVTVPGVYYGQCSELCGVGHAFMPIRLEFIELKRT